MQVAAYKATLSKSFRRDNERNGKWPEASSKVLTKTKQKGGKKEAKTV
jgi:hypothetical protein